MELDLAYIDNWSLRLDMLIFFKTIKTVFLRSGS
jgi:lipopolysaccharide/colanic/teichoic acid biosynthesis glycosyltransferase